MQQSTDTQNKKLIIPILRVWHTFNAEKLHNVDSGKKDLLPLPNTKSSPYVDTLIKDSKIAPEILIYSGENLSENQKKQFEDLHQKAKARGGTLFVLNGDEHFKKEMDMKIPREFGELCQKGNWLTLFADKSKDEKVYAGAFIDLQRFVYLNNVRKIELIINRKYKTDYNFQGVFYCDFDRDPLLNIKDLITKMPTRTLYPIEIKGVDRKNLVKNEESIDVVCKAISKKEKLVNTNKDEVNLRQFIKDFGTELSYCLFTDLRANQHLELIFTKLSQKDVHTYSREYSMKISTFGKIVFRSISEKDQVNPSSIITSTKDKCAKVYQALHEVCDKNKLPGLQKVEFCKDFSWQKDVSHEILDDYYTKNSRTSSLVNTYFTIEQVEKVFGIKITLK